MFRRLRYTLSTQTRESKAEELLSSRLNSDDDPFTGDELSPKLSIFGEMNPIENAQMLSVSAEVSPSRIFLGVMRYTATSGTCGSQR